MHFDIETVSDVLSLISKMDKQLDIELTGKKNKKGNIIQILIVKIKN